MTTHKPTNGKLELPNPLNSNVSVDIDDISFVDVARVSEGVFVLRIYLRSGTAVDAPATAANIFCLESLGITVKNKKLIAEVQPKEASEPVEGDSNPSDDSDPVPVSTPAVKAEIGRKSRRPK